MYSQYPDVSFSWNVHRFGNKTVPMQELFLDWEVTFLEGQIEGSEQLNADLREIIHTQEERLVNHTKAGNTGGTMLDDHHLTTRFQNWNLFYVDHPAVEVLWSFLKEAHDRYLDLYDMTSPPNPSVQSWANVLRSGDEISEHVHVKSAKQVGGYLSTNYCVTADEDTATVYDLPGFSDRESRFTNHPGQLLVFPPWIPHYTTPFTRDDSTRITIASDITMRHWHPSSFDGETRKRHFLPFDSPPSIKRRRRSDETTWEDIPSVDGTIARLVNHDGELTEDDLIEMKQQGTEFAGHAIVPDGVPDTE